MLSMLTASFSTISIHVPARGTTVIKFFYDKRRMISIHVPARGTTAVRRIDRKAFFDFNPRPREGDDYIWPHSTPIS